MRRRREPEEAGITAVTHDGRGIADTEGKKVFVAGALAGEKVRFQRRKSRRKFDEAELLEVLDASPDRVDARCAVFGRCGGCSLQHVNTAQQRDIKFGTLRDNLASGRMPRGLCLVIASWIRYVAGTDEAGQPIDVRDPMADYLKLAATSADSVKALLSIEAIFGPDLAGNAEVVAAIQSAYRQLSDEGAAKTVMAYLEQPA